MIGDLVKRWLLPGDTQAQDESTEADQSARLGQETHESWSPAGPPAAVDTQGQMVQHRPAGMSAWHEVGTPPRLGQQAPLTPKPVKKSLLSFLRLRGKKNRTGTPSGRGGNHDGAPRLQGSTSGLRQGRASGPGPARMQPMQGGYAIPGARRPAGQPGMMGKAGIQRRAVPFQPTPRYLGEGRQGYLGPPMREPDAPLDTRTSGAWHGGSREFRGYQHLPGHPDGHPFPSAPPRAHAAPRRRLRPSQRRLPPGPPWL